MKRVFMVWESGGSYDTTYAEPILAFETEEEAQQAVAAIQKEMAAVWEIGDWSDFSTSRRNEKSGDENANDFYIRIRDEWRQKILDICKVYPIDPEDVQIPGANNDVEFYTADMPISKLSDLQKSG